MHIATVAEKILAGVSQMPIDTGCRPVYATVSIGGAAYPEQAKTSYEVMTRAETALAEAKRAGRDCYVPYRISDEQRHRHRVGMALGERVQRALRDNRLCLRLSAGRRRRHRRRRLLRVPAAHDRRGRPRHRRRRFRRRDRAAGLHPPDRPLSCSSARSRRSAQHPDVCLGFNISGLTATDRAWLRGASAMLQGKPRHREPPRRRDHRDRGAARHRRIRAASSPRCAISAAALRSTISARASPRCAISRRSPSTP